MVGVDDHNEVCKWFADARRDAEYLQWDTEYFYDVDDSYNPTNHDLTMLSVTYPGARCGIQMLYVGGNAEDGRSIISSLNLKHCVV